MQTLIWKHSNFEDLTNSSVHNCRWLELNGKGIFQKRYSLSNREVRLQDGYRKFKVPYITRALFL